MSKSEDKRNPMTRRELHELVWSTPMQQLAPRFKVSNTWLAKICRECGIPTPPRGYWAKKAAGKRVRPRPLPKKLDPEEVVVSVLTTTEPEPPPPPPNDPDVAEALERARALPKGQALVDRASTHPLVAGARKDLKAGEDHGLADTRLGWVCPRHEEGKPRLRIEVHASLVDRALLVVNTLLSTLEDLGFETSQVAVNDPRAGVREAGVYTSVLGEHLCFRLRERLKMVKVEYEDSWRSAGHTWEGTGRLELQLRSSPSGYDIRKWRDGRRGNVELRIREIALGTIRAAQEHRRRRLEQERLERAREEARLAAEREAERRREEQRRVDALIEMSERWQRTEAIRGFVRACRSEAESGPRGGRAASDDHVGTAAVAWLRWAEAVADDLDPLADGLERVMERTRPDQERRRSSPPWMPNLEGDHEVDEP